MDTIKDGVKAITYEDFARFGPCWLTDEHKRAEHAEQLARYRAMREKWTALDILRIDEVSADDRLWLVLREELLDAPILHEFACRCAERALSRVHNPDPRSISAIETKRKWLRGECTGFELAAAMDAVMDAAYEVAMPAACADPAEAYVAFSAASASWSAANSSEAYAARTASCSAALAASWSAAVPAAVPAARFAAWYAARSAERSAAWYAARHAEVDWQVAELIKMLEG